MRIFFDHQTFSQQMYGGISRYFCELITGIKTIEMHNAYLSLLWSNNIHLQEYHLNKFPYPFPDRKRFLYRTNQYWNLLEMKNKQYDIYHATYYDPYFTNYINQKPYVVTYYDMIYEVLFNKFKELKQASHVIKWKHIISEKATALISISESTKMDMVNYLNIAPERIHVVHLGSSLTLPSHTDLKNIHTHKPYFLYVGNRTMYKNFIPLILAMSSVLKRFDVRLICAGGGSFTSDEHSYMHALGLTNLVEQVSITNESLALLYNRAIAFIFPSLYEGFGLPILEAFTCECPCIVSNRGALPEVAGLAALYIDPEREDSIIDAVERLIQDSVLRNNLIINGSKQLKGFSWQKTVEKTLAVYSSINI